MELIWQQQQTLANGASVLRFQTSIDTLWQPGDRLRVAGLELPVMRSDGRWVECLQAADVPLVWTPAQALQAEPLHQQRWHLPTGGPVLVVADEAGLATALHAAQLWFRNNKQVLMLLQLEVPTPFSLRPSQFMVQGLPPGVIAAAPLLEDWGIASRIACEDFLPGCFQGDVRELAQHWLAGQAQVSVLAAGGAALQTPLAGVAGWQFSLQG